MTASEDEVESCRERALMLLGQRPHSVAEITRKLARKGFSRKAVDAVVADFLRVGLLDDREFAVAFCSQRLSSSRPAGTIRLKADLHRRGIAAQDADRAIAEAMEELGEDGEFALALEAARSKWRQVVTRGKDDTFKIRQKVLRFLAARGFVGEICCRAVDAVAEEENDGTQAGGTGHQ